MTEKERQHKCSKHILIDAVQEMLEKTSTEQLREFLEDEFEKDADLRQRFVDFVSKPAVKLAARANKRRDYEILIYDTIKSVHKIKSGKELTDRLTQQWLEQYKRRPAFCEVIRTFRKNNGLL